MALLEWKVLGKNISQEQKGYEVLMVILNLPANFHLHLAAHVRSGFDNFSHLLGTL